MIATPPETHYAIAKVCLGRGLPVLIEKPVALSSKQADELASMGGIAFAGHTRLYSPAWRAFKQLATHVEAWAGGTTRDPWWDWGPHLVAMSLDLGCESPVIHVTKEKQPLRLVADGREFTDTHDGALSVLVGEFWQAIKAGKPNNDGLRLGARVVHFLERECPLQT